jgi:hypothetical protein
MDRRLELCLEDALHSGEADGDMSQQVSPNNLIVAMSVLGAIVVGGLVVKGPLLLLGAAAAVGILYLPARWKVTLLVVISQMPFTFGAIGSIPDVLVVEVLAGPILGLAVVDAVRTGRSLIPRQAGMVSILVALFALVAVYHAVRSGPGSIGNDVSAPNLRAYIDLFIGIAVFVGTLYWSEVEDGWTDGPLVVIATLGLGIGLVRLGAYFMGIPMPLLGGRFQYDVVTSVSGVAAARIGGLTESASFAIGGALGLWHSRRLPLLALVCGVAGVVFAVVSGGRSYAIGLLAGLLVYSTLLRGRRLWLRILAMSAAGALAAVSVAAVGLGAQLTRISAFAGGIEGQDPYRYSAMRFLWVEFLRSPVIGKGIGAPGVGLVNQFVSDVVSNGGHSAYLSVLAIFGVVGLASFVAVAAGGIIRSWHALRRRVEPLGSPAAGWLTMLLFVLVTRVLESTVAGNGYSDFGMYAIGAAAIGAYLPRDAGDADA